MRTNWNASATVVSATDYYPFGLSMEGRSWSNPEFSEGMSAEASAKAGYRYGFNGKEKDPSGEWGSEAIYDYGFRIYNPNIAKFLSVDPLTKSYPMLTPYQFASNRPIDGIDLDGLEFYKKETFLGFDMAFKKVDENSYEIVNITARIDKEAMDRSSIVNQLKSNRRNSDLGLNNLRKGNSALKSITAKGDGVFYSSETSKLGRVLSTTSRVTAFGAIANELIKGHENINKKAAVINTARISGMIEYDQVSLSWFMDVTDNFLKSEEFKSLEFSSPEEFTEFMNFAFDGQKPLREPNDFGVRFFDTDKIEKFKGYFDVMKQFYENDQINGWVELDLGDNNTQINDERKMDTQPKPIRRNN